MSGETISCACPKCGKKFNLKAELEGKRVVCKACGNKFEVRRQQEQQQAAVAAEKKAAAAEAKVAAGGEGEAKAAAAAAEPAAQAQPAASESLDAPIPIDDTPIPVDAETPGEAQTLISTKAQQATQEEEEIKIDTSGPYYVAKVFLTGKMVHVKIEEELNKYANLGWHVCQMLQIKDEAYVVFENPDRWKEVEERLKQGGDGQS
jgi:transcription elongation factor Elf1